MQFEPPPIGTQQPVSSCLRLSALTSVSPLTTVRWRARWTMSSTQAAPPRLAAALSPAAGPTTWMQVIKKKQKKTLRHILCVAEPRSMSTQRLLATKIPENSQIC